ncbi:MAG: hypothetical protein ACOYL5_10055 [Phototrophicaceae bacterium]|jgi:hypothetical protein
MADKPSFCWNCWRDWKYEFLRLSPWEQEQFLADYPRVNPNLYERGRCPFCGTRYNDHKNPFALAFDFDLDDEPNERLNSESDYPKADWEKNDDR